MASFSDLIPVINKLQNVLATVGSDLVDLPQIVVVGSQSSGKSSVLESIVGRDFLPRGTGIVTRRPLILQLTQLSRAVADVAVAANGGHEEWAEFLHLPEQKFFDFDAVRTEISAETDRLVGTNKGVSHSPISLRIFSPRVLNLTLVDLPGITKVPVGDQPRDIEKQIRDMVLSYIERPNALILAVSAANVDLANSDALQLAKLVDPAGQRTIGVLTKLDLMDAGTDALDVLSNGVIALKLGFIGVVNRSQADINHKKSVLDAHAAESAFFDSHPAYRPIASRCGTAFLTRTLNKLLIAHIKACLPTLKKRVSGMMQAATSEMTALGAPVDEHGRGGLVLEIITKFVSDMRASIDGTMTAISTSELTGGARIAYIFHELYFEAIERIAPCDGLSEDDIRTLIRNATGTRGGLFLPEASFEVLVKKAIQRLREPALQCVSLVFEELMTLLNAYDTKELQRFAVLRERLHAAAVETFQKCLKPTNSMVANLINIELAYVNTRHPEFVRALAAMQVPVPTRDDSNGGFVVVDARSGAGAAAAAAPAAPADKKKGSSSSGGGFFGGGKKSAGADPAANEVTYAPPQLKAPRAAAEPLSETALVRQLLEAYFAIVKRSVQDSVPKSIMMFLVSNAASHLQNELIKALYHEDVLCDLVEESPDVSARRAVLQAQLGVLRQADKILAEIRDFRPRASETGWASGAPGASGDAEE